MFWTLNVEFISLVRQFFKKYFHPFIFHIQRQTIEYPLLNVSFLYLPATHREQQS